MANLNQAMNPPVPMSRLSQATNPLSTPISLHHPNHPPAMRRQKQQRNRVTTATGHPKPISISPRQQKLPPTHCHLNTKYVQYMSRHESSNQNFSPWKAVSWIEPVLRRSEKSIEHTIQIRSGSMSFLKIKTTCVCGAWNIPGTLTASYHCPSLQTSSRKQLSVRGTSCSDLPEARKWQEEK